MKESKLRKFYLILMRLSPRLQRMIIQWAYNQFAIRNQSTKPVFLNYGYHDQTDFSLKPEDEPNRYFIQLYQRTVQAIDLQGKDVVEIGCGQGAGGDFLLRYKNLRSYLGIDLSHEAINCCKRHGQLSNAHWLQGPADALPLPDKSADVVINIESSHFYPSMTKFLAEVTRILKPKGYLAFSDIRLTSMVSGLDDCFNASGLQLIQRDDITAQVLDSLTYLSDRRKAYINQTYSRFWRQALRDLSAVKGTVTYNSFINGQQKYLCYLLQKR